MKRMLSFRYLFLLLLLQQCFCLPAQNLQVIDSIRNLIKSNPDDKTKISALISISSLYQDNNTDKAFEFGLQALTFSIQLDYKKGIAEAHNNLGDLYWYKADYASSSDHYFKALKLYEDLKDRAAIADCYRNIGWICDQQKNNTDALNYYMKALAINQELNRKKEMGQNHNDIGIIYLKLEKYKEALSSYHNAIIIQEAVGNKVGLSANYDNISVVYDKMGKITLAIENVQKSIKISEEIGNKRYLSGSYSSLGGLYSKVDKYKDAAVSLQKAMNYAKEINDKSLLKTSYDSISALSAKQNDFRKALQYIALSSALNDSIFNENNSKQANEMTALYESEKKELLINNLEKDNALADEKMQREKNFKIYLIIFCVMIAALVFILLKGYIQKRKANKALSFAYEEIEEKNKDITDSINYSKRIQEASLSAKELKTKLFPDSFVLFKPKDIVSGDFYWYAEKEGKRMIASCDCTGHGVPGALMSMLGNNILNQIVNEKGITKPDEILNHLHKGIRKALKQEDQSSSKDGMDIALITFNNETEIEYAGAQRPLWISRKIDNGELTIDNGAPQQQLTNNYELIEIKADKFSIGGLQTEAERKFTKHTISLSKEDRIYIFTDGLIDQFGGTEGKKFMSKRFKDLLLANYSKSMNEQEKIIRETFETWKGSHEQIDDVLVIGIKI